MACSPDCLRGPERSGAWLGVVAGGTAVALGSGSPGEILVCLTATGTLAGPRRPCCPSTS